MALTADRNTPEASGANRRALVLASVQIYAGAILMRNAAGYATKGQTATGLVGIGRAEQRVLGGANNGDVHVNYRPGVFRFLNSASGDLITIADIGEPCWAVDDEKVAKTSGTGTRSIAGFIDDVDDLGVWVRFDEIAVVSYLAGLANPA